jgi:hypothetical protein
MGLTEKDDMIQARAADQLDQSFGKAILPR